MIGKVVRLKKKLQEKGDIQKILFSAVFSMSIKVLAVLAGFMMNLVFSRYMGPEGVGRFFLIFSMISIVSMIGKFGFDRTVLRFISAYSSKKEWGKVKGVQYFSFNVVGVLTVIISLSIYVFAEVISNYVYHDPGLTFSIRLFAICIAPLALIQNTCESLKGINRIQLGLFLYNTLLPALATIIFFFNPLKNTTTAISSYLIACGITFLLTHGIWYYLMYKIPEKRTSVESSTLLQSAIPMFWSSIFQQLILWMPTFMMGIWATNSDTGIFEVARRTAQLTTFFAAAFNSILAPKIAALYAENDIKKIEYTCIRTTKMIALFSFPVFAAFIFFPQYFMQLFGHNFKGGASYLVILCIGQFVNVLTGPVGFILMMCGKERKMRNTFIFSAITLLVLNYIFIPYWGGLGAAITSCIILILQNVIAAIYVWREFGILAIPFLPRINLSKNRT